MDLAGTGWRTRATVADERGVSGRPRVAAIVPAWNEAGSIGLVVGAIPRDLVDVVIVVDGGSDDGTAEVARAAGARVVGQDRPGYGAACAAGVRAALAEDAELLVFLD